MHTKKGGVYRLDGSLGDVVEGIRRDDLLDEGWVSSLEGGPWVKVNVPHNWDEYDGYRRLRHGNLHGTAMYRKYFWSDSLRKDRRSFLWFEGVGSYATVWVNGKKAGYHAGGRTSFTIDITEALLPGQNILEVRAEHPAFIKDLPWVCGGCSDDRGFSEGSQPLGIFRPVHLVETGLIRIEPFGVHVWNDTTCSRVWVETEVENAKDVVVRQVLRDKEGREMVSGEARQGVRQQLMVVSPRLWSMEDPYLYTLVTEVVIRGKVVDRVETPYGIRRVQWTEHGFLLNGKPIFINGIAEYEHRFGGSHAFEDAEIRARVAQLQGAGFNAFRDAHQPHNLRYQHYWDSLGILWWPQLSAHVWYDSPEFRRNFKANLIEWVKERRNSPSIVLWGLQNESKLPEDFARECTELIRQLDPTAVDQRRVTTCNGGQGTDWDVPQNWTGTYGGDPATYGADLKRQVLVGEYGGWRSLDLHGDVQYSEDRLSGLMEQKIRLADSVKDQVAGHFAWLFNSHDNPGRVQSGEGRRPLDQIGPVNYKGLLTSWGEPADVYYVYRSNFVSAHKEPMVYIASHARGVTVYSNCEEVELFNDVREHSLGRRKRRGVGTHFQWDSVALRYNVLYAVGYVGGKEVAVDRVVLKDLEKAPHFDRLYDGGEILGAAGGYNYLYRVNCGGLDYVDHQGNTWMADRHLKGGSGGAPAGAWGSWSWTDGYDSLPAFFASQRRTDGPIGGTADWALFQDFRYGREKLGYSFPVQDGDYRVELYFVEPWWGRGGGLDARGMRLFDVAVNGATVIRDLDVFKEAGYSKALRKVVNVHVAGGVLNISFPRVAVGQAIISAVAVASLDGKVRPAPGSTEIFSEEVPRGTKLEPAYDSRPVTTYKTAAGRVSGDTTEWEMSVGVGDLYSLAIKYRWLAAGTGKLEVRLLDGTLIKEEEVKLVTTAAGKWNYISTTTGTMINAGRYTVRLIARMPEGSKVDELQVQ
ncbi:MAG: DUF4982 domain-containing protein [Bacteroidetes bacterium]|nr:DUF4982 domain-containing protein [Bacteroidota bacterium]